MNLTTPLTISTILHSAALAAVLTVGVQMVPERVDVDLERFVRVEPIRPTSTGHVTVAAWVEPQEESVTPHAPEPVAEPAAEAVAEPAPEEPAPVVEPPPERVAEPAPVEEVTPEPIIEPAPVVEPPPERVAESVEPQSEPQDRPVEREAVAEAPTVEPAAPAAEAVAAGESADAEVRLPGDSEVAMAWPGAGELESEPLVEEEPAGLGVDLDALEAAYRDLLNRAVQRAYRYPRVAQRAGIEGTVVVRVTLTGEGQVREVVVVRTSGHGILDRAAVDAIASIGSFPVPPPELAASGGFRTFDIPVGYSLRM